MKGLVVRLIKADLRNIKNVEHGSIDFISYNSVMNRAELSGSDIIGIYGQNGSGKTTMIESLDILKHVLSGLSVSASDYAGIIDADGNTSISALFFIKTNKQEYLIEYSVFLGVVNTDEKVRISIRGEKLTYKIRQKTWCRERTIYFENPFYDTDLILNSANNVKLQSIYANQFQQLEFVKSLQSIAVYAAQKGSSVLFNSIVQRSLSEVDENYGDGFHLAVILQQLNHFALHSMVVIKVSQLGAINENDILPLNVHEYFDNTLLLGCFPLVMKGSGTIPKSVYLPFKKTIDAINIALKAIVPNLQLVLQVGTEEVNEKGIALINVEVYSVRNKKRFSTRYESEGIKRIISLLSCLISVYNDEKMCLIVDELDSGIFEYLLGELLGVLYEEAKGQLIFTSHNLRAFEKLGTKNIICSTVDPQNRYTRLSGIQANHNKRDFYIRSLVLGGQKYRLYEQEDLDSIGYAFRKARGNQEPVKIRLSEEFRKILESGDKNG